MVTKILGGKKIIIRELMKSDLKIIKSFQEFINSLVIEDAKIMANEKVTMKEEKIWLLNTLKSIKNKKKVCIVAQHENKIVGISEIEQGRGRGDHVGRFGISIRDGYRGIGLGKYLMQKIISMAKKDPKGLKMIKLDVLENNKPATILYGKMGFKKVARVPKQLQYKGKLIADIKMLLEL